MAFALGAPTSSLKQTCHAAQSKKHCDNNTSVRMRGTLIFLSLAYYVNIYHIFRSTVLQNTCICQHTDIPCSHSPVVSKTPLNRLMWLTKVGFLSFSADTQSLPLWTKGNCHTQASVMSIQFPGFIKQAKTVMLKVSAFYNRKYSV